jgi:hypothetical protein
MSDVGVATSALPPLHSAWLGTLTGVHDQPSEPKATCDDCVMCAGVERSGSRVTFSPDVKCCSYIPHVANFLAGRALAGPGRWSVLQRVESRAGVTPLGLGLSRADVRQMVGDQSHFGRSTVVRCPHFAEQTQGCAIWETRNAVCSTWFCKHERGAVTQRFWHAVRDLLIVAEERIAHHCLGQGGMPDEQVRAVLDQRAAMRETVRKANAGEGLAVDADDDSPDWYARMWGAWQGREEQWFERCAQSVAAVDDGELISLMGSTAHLVEDVGRSWADLDGRHLCDRLRLALNPGSEATADVLRLVGYSPFDPLVLPTSLQPSLQLLDGRPIAQVLTEIQQAHAIHLDDELLARLHDFGVAIAPKS